MYLSEDLKTESINDFNQEAVANQVEVLRSVVMLVLREIDLLEKSIMLSSVGLRESDYCLPKKLEQLEVATIKCALIKTNGRQKVAAKLLGIKHTTLNSKIKKHNINWRLPYTGDELIA